MEYKIDLSYENVLPRLWFLMLIKTNFTLKNESDRFYPFGGYTKKQLYYILDKIKNFPDDTAQRLQKNNCVYCGKDNPFNHKGDHIVKKAIRKEFPQLDNLVFRVNCCRSCNSSKGAKDLLDWWLNHKQKSILELTMDHISLYTRAQWQIHKTTSSLPDLVPEFWKNCIEELHHHLHSKSYEKIWNL